MTENSGLAHEVINELRVIKEQPPFKATPDIDMVWAVSAPGTVKSPEIDGIYKGRHADLEVVEPAIQLVREVAALRTGKEVGLVTKSDIAEKGPVYYYNGESAKTKNFVYPQNEDMRAMAKEPQFPIPESKIVVEDIDELGTHTQIKKLAEFLHKLENRSIKKIAVVGLVHHSRRISRYIQRYKDLFPEDVVLVSVPVADRLNPVGATLREVRKVVKYAKKGDLAKEPYF